MKKIWSMKFQYGHMLFIIHIMSSIQRYLVKPSFRAVFFAENLKVICLYPQLLIWGWINCCEFWADKMKTLKVIALCNSNFYYWISLPWILNKKYNYHHNHSYHDSIWYICFLCTLGSSIQPTYSQGSSNSINSRPTDDLSTVCESLLKL